MKRFRNIHECIHGWASRQYPEGRCGNVFFKGDKIYSYGHHFLIAEFIENKEGEQAVMMNSNSFSVSTSSHQSITGSAVTHYTKFYTGNKIMKVGNLLRTELKSFEKAKKPELYIAKANSIINGMKAYDEWLGISSSKEERIELRKIDKLMACFDSKGNFSELLDKEKRRKKNRDRAEKRKRIAAYEKDIQDFYNYEINRFLKPYSGMEDHVRVSKCREFVETSKNLRVSAKEARVLYALIKAKRDIKGHKIGAYTVTSINGTLKIGCHNIDLDSVHRVGKQLT